MRRITKQRIAELEKAATELKGIQAMADLEGAVGALLEKGLGRRTISAFTTTAYRIGDTEPLGWLIEAADTLSKLPGYRETQVLEIVENAKKAA